MMVDVFKGLVCKFGVGIVQLVKYFGWLIFFVVVVISCSIEFDSWDKVSVNLLFGCGSIVVGFLIWVLDDVDDEVFEGYCKQVED